MIDVFTNWHPVENVLRNKWLIKGMHDLNDADYEAAEFQIDNRVLVNLGFDLIRFAKGEKIWENDIDLFIADYLSQVELTPNWKKALTVMLGEKLHSGIKDFISEDRFFRREWEAGYYVPLVQYHVVYYDHMGRGLQVVFGETEDYVLQYGNDR